MKNTRNTSMSPGQGKEGKDSSQLTGQASKTKAENSKNETKQYTTGSSEKGALGGMNTNS